MQKWEYLEVMVYGAAATPPTSVIANGQRVSECEPKRGLNIWLYLNKLGQEGWEMVSHSYLGGLYRVYNFKRLCPD